MIAALEVTPMSGPHPGQLRHMVTIGQTVNAVNENGYPAETDTVVCRVWAAIRDESSGYTHTGDADNAERGLRFVIRWRSDIKPGMWVMWRDEKQRITKLGEFDFKCRYLELVTESVKGVD